MNILIGKNLDPKVKDLILDKQASLRKEKNRVVSLEYAIEKLLKDAYLSGKKVNAG